jgi:hypothetical protein
MGKHTIMPTINVRRVASRRFWLLRRPSVCIVNDFFLVTIFFGIALKLRFASGGAKKYCLSFDVGLVLRCLFINHHSTYRVFEHVYVTCIYIRKKVSVFTSGSGTTLCIIVQCSLSASNTEFN